jgi:UDP-MurNAc hydroxylase
MKFIYIGGATALLEHKGKIFLFDPWLIDGIFHGAWFHYPPVQIKVESLPRIDYLYISHIHEDHCHEETLKYINKDCEIILIDRNPNYVKNFLDRNKFNFSKIHLVKEKEPIEIAPGLRVDLLMSNPNHNLSYMIDSAIIIEWDGYLIYNANDCAPHKASNKYILENYGRVDLALLPYAAGSSYPACYMNLNEEQKMAEKMRIYHESLDKFFENVEILKPKVAIPFADSYCIVGSNANLNKYMPHPAGMGDVVDAAKRKKILESRVVVLNSMQSLDLLSGEKNPNNEYNRFTDEDREKYIQMHTSEKMYDFEKIKFGSSVPTKRILSLCRINMWKNQMSEGYFPDFRYYINDKDNARTFVIDFKSDSIIETPYCENLLKPYLGINVSNTLLCMMMIGHISWNIADAALFIQYDRAPNNYDPKLFSYLNFLRL